MNEDTFCYFVNEDTFCYFVNEDNFCYFVLQSERPDAMLPVGML